MKNWMGTVLAFAGFALIACGKGSDTMDKFQADPDLKAQIEKVKDYRIFFGHQSVGDNIVAGVEDLERLAGTDAIQVVKWTPGVELPPAFLAHGYVGGNRKPESKFSDFAKALDGELSGKVDLAFMKLCYVDIHKDTDIDGLFQSYVSTVEDLKKRHPGVVLVHVTTPLMVKEGWNKYKYLVKTMLMVENDNVKRNAFNTMLRQRFAQEPIFDLEAIESTHPDGKREAFGRGDKYLGLVRGYTYDGGHLNEYGRQLVARELIRFLAGLKVGSRSAEAVGTAAN